LIQEANYKEKNLRLDDDDNGGDNKIIIRILITKSAETAERNKETFDA
jgi:hypothetical protein